MQYFPTDYFAARERFTALATAHGARIETHPLQARGPGGETLTIDTAYFGAPAPLRLLIISSAIHGAEGFAGSALQQYFISDLVEDSDLPDRGGILLVHALNPYGFAHLRRANENNVDLNRNCLDHFPGPTNLAYDAFDALLNPRSPPKPDLFVPRVLWRGLRLGADSARQAIAGGQYAHPRGLFFGGTSKEESIVLFEHILKTSAYTRVATVLHIDVHTGLGKYGGYKLFTDTAKDTIDFQHLQEWFGARVVASGVASGTYAASGLIGASTRVAFEGARVYAATLEFGTYSWLRVLASLRDENRLHQYAGLDFPNARKVKTQFLEAFCPRDDAWKLAVLQQGRKIFEQAKTALVA